MVETTTKYVIGYAIFGIMARALSLGIQRRPLSTAPGWYFGSGAVFGGIGYWLAGVDARNAAFIEVKKRELLENRVRADAIYARRKAAEEEASTHSSL